MKKYTALSLKKSILKRLGLCVLVLLLFISGPLNIRAFADATTCPQGMSQLDCNALQGGWTSWVPDDGTSCTANGTTGSTAPGSAPAAAGLSGRQVAFLVQYHDIAQSLSIQYGIPWEAVMAQGIIESAAGTSHLALTRNNFFGIGAVDSNPDAATSFPTPQAGWQGYYDFISGNSRYAAHGVFKEPAITDPIAYLTDIKAAGYATDPTYVSKNGAVVTAIEKLAATKSWVLSPQLATGHPEMLTNAAKYAAGAGSTGSTSSSDGSTASCDSSSSTDSTSLGVGKGSFVDTGEVAGYANILANAQKTNAAFGNKLVGKGNCSFIVAIVWKGINNSSIGYTGGAKNIWYQHEAVGHADRNIKKGAIMIYSDSALGHVAIYLGNNKALNDGQIVDASFIEDSWHENYLGWIDPNNLGLPSPQAASESDLTTWLTPFEQRNPYGV